MEKNLEDVKNIVMSDESKFIEDDSNKLNVLLDVNEDVDKYTFETFLLPYIIGSVELTDDVLAVFSYNYRKLTKGSFRVPLYVMDDDGSVLYKLPPLFLGVDTEESSKISFAKIINSFITGVENNNLNANKILSKNLNKASEHIHTDIEKYEFYRGELQKIYSDYKHLIKDKINIINEDEIEDDFLDY